jgi:hypothetical protein
MLPPSIRTAKNHIRNDHRPFFWDDRCRMREWDGLKKTANSIHEVASKVKSVFNGWLNYYGKFYKAKLINFRQMVNLKLARWARRKYKNLGVNEMKRSNGCMEYLCEGGPYMLTGLYLDRKQRMDKRGPYNGSLLCTVLTAPRAEMPGFTYQYLSL